MSSMLINFMIMLLKKIINLVTQKSLFLYSAAEEIL